jgi:DNA-directed RNA polymerase specialized sigma24 family protein
MTPSTRGFWWGFQSRAVLSAASGRVVPPDPTDWPSLWARCWSRISSWRVPPRWSHHEWLEEARAQGALAACEAIRAFDSSRLVPLDAFLYRRVVEGVWARYRQEWSFGRRCRPDASLADYATTEPGLPDPELLDRLADVLRTLDEGERRLIRQLFWDARSEDQLALELGITRQAVNKRKRKLLRRLRSDLMLDGVA